MPIWNDDNDNADNQEKQQVCAVSICAFIAVLHIGDVSGCTDFGKDSILLVDFQKRKITARKRETTNIKYEWIKNRKRKKRGAALRRRNVQAKRTGTAKNSIQIFQIICFWIFDWINNSDNNNNNSNDNNNRKQIKWNSNSTGIVTAQTKRASTYTQYVNICDLCAYSKGFFSAELWLSAYSLYYFGLCIQHVLFLRLESIHICAC